MTLTRTMHGIDDVRVYAALMLCYTLSPPLR